MVKRPARSVGAALVRGASWLRRRGLDDARLDADLLLGEVLGLDRVGLLRRAPEDVPRDVLLRFARLLRRRRDHEPVAYLRGRREFHGLDFEVGPGVLVPRPDTERLIEVAAAVLDARADSRPGVVLDVGTGSGNIAVTLARIRPGTRVVAVDASPRAARTARRNAVRHGVGDQVTVLRGDVRSLAHTFNEGSFDLVVSNPPYVDPGEPALRTELRHEPRLALVGEVGRFPAVYVALAGAAVRLLRANGGLCFEVGAGQADAVAGVIEATGAFGPVRAYRDLGGIDRVVGAVRSPSDP